MSATTFDPIADLILRDSGVWLRPSQRNALRAAVARVAPGVDPAMFLHLASDPVRGPGVRARLIEEITVQETSFLRDRGQLDTIDWLRLRDLALAAGSQTIRVWSAGCATGEEAYTLALLACEAFGTPAPPVRILGTDISGAALESARGGSYGQRAARALDPALRDLYFDSDGNSLVVGERLRRLVTFAGHNLVRDPIPPAGEARFDLILCRNILIYFEPATVARTAAALGGALRASGTLMLGAPDALCVSGTITPVVAAQPAPDTQSLRRPLGRLPAGDTPADRLDRALRAADQGHHAEAIRESSELLVDDPLNADAYFLRGLVELEAGDAPAAVRSLRGALYIYPTFGAAAFKLGRAYEAVGDPTAACRAYGQALRTIDGEEEHHVPLLDQVEVEEIATACAARISALGAGLAR
jgi:chemotaxis protein methyltransferase CheR